MTNELPIVVIGAGPIGLAAAAHLNSRNLPFKILESGRQIADSVRSWEHVSMFSPWKYNLDETAKKLLSRYNWTEPKGAKIPTGKELIEEYLLPLSETEEIKPFIQLSAKVIAIGRKRLHKMRTHNRENAPFIIHVETLKGTEVIYAKAIIDASGTWKTPNPAGSSGLPAIGELDLGSHMHYGIPDILGKHRSKYFNKSVAVIGGGHSAINVLLELADLKKEASSMNITWILTKGKVEETYGGLHDDELPGRGRVGQRIKELVEAEMIDVRTPFFIESFTKEDGKILIDGYSPSVVDPIYVDEIITATGLRPDLNILSEIRLDIDPSTEAPTRLAPMIDPNVHSCGSVKPHGEAELRHPEEDFYIVGLKSYGRAPTFLLATGYEQVRSVVAGLAGDWKAARDVKLELPETGVCGVAPAVDPNEITKQVAAPEATNCCTAEAEKELTKEADPLLK